MTNFDNSIRKLAVVVGGAFLACASAQAAPPGATADAQARYRQEVAVCNSGQSNQDRSTCRLEAQRALAAARAGLLSDAPGQYQRNASQRCEALRGDERADCQSRMRGMGSAQGSVGGGGILRETVTTTVTPAK